MKKKDLKIKQEMTTEETVKLLDEIRKSLSEGTLSIEYGEKQITLKPGCRIESTIEASQKKGKQKLNITLAWQDEDPVCSSQPELKISSQELEPVVEEVDEDSGEDEKSSVLSQGDEKKVEKKEDVKLSEKTKNGNKTETETKTKTEINLKTETKPEIKLKY